MPKCRHPLFVSVGSKIRDARNAKGVLQEDFARTAGLARGFYGRLERGEHNISVMTILRIAMELGVEPSVLLPTLEETKQMLDNNP